MTVALSARAADFGALDTPLLVLALPSGSSIDGALEVLDRRLGGVLRRTLERRDFRGARDETLHLSSTGAGVERLLLVGIGNAEDRAASPRRGGAIAARPTLKLGGRRLTLSASAILQ